MKTAIEKKYLVFVNGLFMCGHYTYKGAKKTAERFKDSKVEIKLNGGK